MRRHAALALLLAAACHPAYERPQPARSKLVVLLVLDQWPEWAFEQKRPALTGGGFERLLAEGEWRIGEHPSAATLTAPGHALLASGAASAQSGILANEWYHREAGKRLQSVEGEDGKPSAKWLRVPGLADAMARAHPAARAVSVSLKDRSAILSLGHAGTPIWYDRKAAAFTSLAAPPWLAAYSAAHPIADRMHAVWEPLDPARLATLSPAGDDQRGELGEKHFGATFPHAPDATGDAADAVFAQPLGNTVTLETALAALDGEHLGTHDAPDYLVISLSAHDYIGHGWGHESWEMWDAELRLDRDLGELLSALDREVGADGWSMIVTSDHGASPLPERTDDGGGRIVFEELQVAANNAAASALGAGEWIADVKYPTVFFTPALLAQPDANRARAIDAVIAGLRAYPGIARVERTAAFTGHCETRTGDAHALCLTLDPERSGELLYLPKPHWVMQEADEPVGTAHGSMQPYDRRVPVILLAPGRTRHAPQLAPNGPVLPMTEIAPTLARWLDVPAPLEMARPRAVRVALP